MNIKVGIGTEYIKLGGFLKLCGISGTGGESKLLVSSGMVLVDGEPCTLRGKKLIPGNIIQISGREEVYEVTGFES